jgi:hypothetical protein
MKYVAEYYGTQGGGDSLEKATDELEYNYGGSIIFEEIEFFECVPIEVERQIIKKEKKVIGTKTVINKVGGKK